MPRSIIRIAAMVLLAIEALLLLLMTVNEVLSLMGGEAEDGATGVALVVITLICAIALGAFAVAVFSQRNWGRSGAVVAQLIIVLFGISALSANFENPLLGITAILLGGLTLVSVLLSRAPDAPSGSDHSMRTN